MFIKFSLLSIIISSAIIINGQQQANQSNQAVCYEVVNSPDNNPLWAQSGLDMNLDWVIKCGDIVAYKLLWPITGQWSDWFVTGVNDLSSLSSGNPTRMWSLFSSHYHIFIICKSNTKKLNGTKC